MKRKPGRPKGSRNKEKKFKWETFGNCINSKVDEDSKLLETGKMTINYQADQSEAKLYEIIGRLYVESQTEKAVWEAPDGESKCSAS